ncbi:hypothetical protein CHUAL_001168 [Chamberlinius hualienensis]
MFNYVKNLVFLSLIFDLTVESYEDNLIINVKNKGGDVLQESVYANTTSDIVILEFQNPEGTLITQLIDFKAEAQVFKALVLGEEERGQSQYQVMCFVFHYQKDDFISSDAMSKLRQKNPGTIRQPEEDKGKEQINMDLYVNLETSSIISSHISNLCSEAANSTYTRKSDLQYWTNLDKDKTKSLNETVKFYVEKEVDSCKNDVSKWNECECKFEACVGWYPCGLKYCKGKDTNGSTINYRCGIKTCRKCFIFDYRVNYKQLCLWGE